MRKKIVIIGSEYRTESGGSGASQGPRSEITILRVKPVVRGARHTDDQ